MVLGYIVTICKDFFKNPKVFEKCAVIHVTKENEKGVFEMTNGIGRIFGGNNYGVGGYVPQRNEQTEEKPAQAPVAPKEQPVDPDRIMDLLSANALTPVKAEPKPVELSPEVAARAAASMADFERFYSIAAEEVGEDLASIVTDAYTEGFLS